MTPIFASERPNWASTIGLFLINFGTLEFLIFAFLESHLPVEELARMKKKHFQDRVDKVRTIVNSDLYNQKHNQAFRNFFDRLDPVRDLRNHIAHGYMLIRVAEEDKTPIMTLSLPKNLDENYDTAIRHLTFDQMIEAQGELTELIEEFKKLSGQWSGGIANVD